MTVGKLKFKKWWDSITDDWLIKINFTYQHWISFQIFDVQMVSDFQIFIAFWSNELWLIFWKTALWLIFDSWHMQYTHHMTWNSISDSVIQKFWRFAHAKILNSLFLSNARAESNFNFQFEFNVKFRVEWFALIKGLKWLYLQFVWK